MSTDTMTPSLEIDPMRLLAARFVLAGACVALADWLFHGHDVGLSLALFLGAMGIVAAMANPINASPHMRLVACGALLAGLLPLIEIIGIVSIAFGVMGLAVFTILMTAANGSEWRSRIRWAFKLPLHGPGWLFADLKHARALARQTEKPIPRLRSLEAWVVPAIFLTVFLWLFASANPLIERWLGEIDFTLLWNFVELDRLVFWAAIIVAIWPFIHVRAARESARKALAGAAIGGAASDPDGFLGATAILRSLVLFNALFALQTGLDIAYLWGGAALPDGMSYAAYAHRGAYPLVGTALLAAGFALVAMRPGGPAEQSTLIRPLVLAWIGQNIVLVVSSMLRLDLYVAAYSLTELRAAALVWMLLVAVGLILMIVQLQRKKPVSWLLTMNSASLALALYACCFINFPYVVAAYNVEHCREVSGAGPDLDQYYLLSLGPQAIPAIDAYARHGLSAERKEALSGHCQDSNFSYCQWRSARLGRLFDDWRGWSFRAWRLDRYLAKNSGADFGFEDGAAPRGQN